MELLWTIANNIRTLYYLADDHLLSFPREPKWMAEKLFPVSDEEQLAVVVERVTGRGNRAVLLLTIQHRTLSGTVPLARLPHLTGESLPCPICLPSLYPDLEAFLQQHPDLSDGVERHLLRINKWLVDRMEGVRKHIEDRENRYRQSKAYRAVEKEVREIINQHLIDMLAEEDLCLPAH